MDSIGPRKKIIIPASKINSSKISEGSSRRASGIDADKDLEKYYQNTKISVQKSEQKNQSESVDFFSKKIRNDKSLEDKSKKGGISWLRNLLFSGIDLGEGNKKESTVVRENVKLSETEKGNIEMIHQEKTISIEEIPTEKGKEKEHITIVEKNEIKELVQDENEEVDQIVNVRNDLTISNINVTENDDGKIEISEEKDIYIEDLVGDGNAEEESSLTLRQQEEVLRVIQEAKGFMEEISEFDWEERGYTEAGRMKAIDLAVEAHIRKIIKYHSPELQDIEEVFLEQIIESIINVIKENDSQ